MTLTLTLTFLPWQSVRTLPTRVVPTRVVPHKQTCGHTFPLLRDDAPRGDASDRSSRRGTVKVKVKGPQAAPPYPFFRPVTIA